MRVDAKNFIFRPPYIPPAMQYSHWLDMPENLSKILGIAAMPKPLAALIS